MNAMADTYIDRYEQTDIHSCSCVVQKKNRTFLLLARATQKKIILLQIAATIINKNLNQEQKLIKLKAKTRPTGKGQQDNGSNKKIRILYSNKKLKRKSFTFLRPS